MNKILLTGFSGFTGAYILKEAARSSTEIICLSEDGSPNSLPIDLLDYQAVQERIKELNPSSVIHLAAISHVRFLFNKCWGNEKHLASFEQTSRR